MDPSEVEPVVTSEVEAGSVGWIRPDRLVTAHTDGSVRIWDTSKRALVRVIRGRAARALAIATGGSIAAAQRDHSVALIDPSSGRTTRIVRGATHDVSSLAFGRGGRLLAVATVEGRIRVWDLELERLVHTLLDQSSGQQVHAAFDPAGERLATSARRFLRVWDVATGREIREIRTSDRCEVGLAWLDECDLLAAASERAGLVVADAASGSTLHQRHGATQALAAHRTWIALAADTSIQLVDRDTGEPQRSLSAMTPGDRRRPSRDDRWHAIAFSPGGATIAATAPNGAIALVDVETGRFDLLAPPIVAKRRDDELRTEERHRALLLLHCGATHGDYGVVERPDGWAVYRSDGHFKSEGDVAGALAHVVGLDRYELDELDSFMAEPLRVPIGAEWPPERTRAPLAAPALLCEPEMTPRPAIVIRRDPSSVEPGRAIWHRRWTGARSATVMTTAVSPGGDIAVVGTLSGPMQWAERVAIDGGDHAAFWLTLDRDGEPRRCSAIPMSTCVNWPALALGSDRAALAFAFQNDGSVDGRPVQSKSTQDILLVIQNDAGEPVLVRQLGERGMSRVTALAYASTGELLMVGQAGDRVDLDAHVVHGTDRCVFLARLAPSGRSLAVTAVGGPYVHPHGASVGPDGSILIWGHFQGEARFGGDLLVARPERHFVAKLDAAHGHAFSHVAGSLDGTGHLGCTTLRDGTMALCGDFETPFEIFGETLSSSSRALFLMKRSATGAPLWTREFPCERGGASVHGMPDGTILIAGSFVGALDLGAGPLTSVGTTRNATPFLAAFEPDGTTRWSRAFGDGERSFWSSVSACEDGSIVVAGEANGALDFGDGAAAPLMGTHLFVARIKV